MMLYLVALVLLRPYNGCFSNISIILNECFATLAVSLALVNKLFKIDSDIEALILFSVQGLIILCFIFSLIRVFLHIRSLCRKEGELQQGEGKQEEREEEGEGREKRRPEAKKKKNITDVDLSLDRAIKEEKKMNPYTAVLPQHSFPTKIRNSGKPRTM